MVLPEVIGQLMSKLLSLNAEDLILATIVVYFLMYFWDKIRDYMENKEKD